MFARSGILRATVIFLAAIAAACIEVNGGAAELSWTLRDFDGRPISGDDPACTITNIEEIRLNWKAVTDGADTGLIPDDSATFQCDDNRGVTEFIIPAGRQMLWIEPICRGEIEAKNYEVPPPIVRNVEEGTVTTLDALLIVADPACTCRTSEPDCTAASR